MIVSSLFNEFIYQNIRLISEIINDFVAGDMNAVQADKNINTELKVVASNKLIRRVSQEMRKIICKTLKIEIITMSCT